MSCSWCTAAPPVGAEDHLPPTETVFGVVYEAEPVDGTRRGGRRVDVGTDSGSLTRPWLPGPDLSSHRGEHALSHEAVKSPRGGGG